MPVPHPLAVELRTSLPVVVHPFVQLLIWPIAVAVVALVLVSHENNFQYKVQ